LSVPAPNGAGHERRAHLACSGVDGKARGEIVRAVKDDVGAAQEFSGIRVCEALAFDLDATFSFSAASAAFARSTFEPPTSAPRKMIWRCRLSSETASSSISRKFPAATPAAAR
jgi:hypothetical protein